MLDGFLKSTNGGVDAGQIEVQDFSAGSGAAGDSKDFLLLTEITSLVTGAQKTSMADKVKAAFPESQVDFAQEGEDRFFVVLK